MADNAIVNDSICEHNISRPIPKRHRPCPCIKTWGHDEWGEVHICTSHDDTYNNLHFYSVKLMIGTNRGHSSEMLTVIVKIHLP